MDPFIAFLSSFTAALALALHALLGSALFDDTLFHFTALRCISWPYVGQVLSEYRLCGCCMGTSLLCLLRCVVTCLHHTALLVCFLLLAGWSPLWWLSVVLCCWFLPALFGFQFLLAGWLWRAPPHTELVQAGLQLSLLATFAELGSGFPWVLRESYQFCLGIPGAVLQKCDSVCHQNLSVGLREFQSVT